MHLARLGSGREPKHTAHTGTFTTQRTRAGTKAAVIAALATTHVLERDEGTMYTDEQKAPEADVYMALRGGRKVYLRCPNPDVFDPYLDAYSLAAENRYGGNYGQYSVAQHCVLVARCVAAMGGTPDQVLGGLHHEDSEAVTGDLPQPVKSLCPDFKALEDRLQRAADRHYGIDSKQPIVKEADRIVFCAEIRRLVPRESWPLYGVYGSTKYRQDLQPSATDLIIWSPDEAAKQFIEFHEQLEKAIA